MIYIEKENRKTTFMVDISQENTKSKQSSFMVTYCHGLIWFSIRTDGKAVRVVASISRIEIFKSEQHGKSRKLNTIVQQHILSTIVQADQ